MSAGEVRHGLSQAMHTIREATYAIKQGEDRFESARFFVTEAVQGSGQYEVEEIPAELSGLINELNANISKSYGLIDKLEGYMGRI